MFDILFIRKNVLSFEFVMTTQGDHNGGRGLLVNRNLRIMLKIMHKLNKTIQN